MDLNSYFNALGQVLFLPFKAILAFIVFLGIVAQFISHLLAGVGHFLESLVSILPDFLIPFMFIIFSVRLFKFITKRHNNFVRD